MLWIKIEVTDICTQLILKVKAIQKCQHCQLCVLRENLKCEQTEHQAAAAGWVADLSNGSGVNLEWQVEQQMHSNGMLPLPLTLTLTLTLTLDAPLDPRCVHTLIAPITSHWSLFKEMHFAKCISILDNSRFKVTFAWYFLDFKWDEVVTCVTTKFYMKLLEKIFTVDRSNFSRKSKI